MLGTLVPDVARDWGLSPSTQVVSGTADNQTAALGTGSIEDGDGYISVGTTSWLSCHVPFKKCNFTGRSIATMPSAVPWSQYRGGVSRAAGRCLESFVEPLIYGERGFQDSGERARAYEELFHEAAGVAARDRTACCFFPGLTAPGLPPPMETPAGAFSIKRCGRGGPTPCGPSWKGSLSTCAGSCRTWSVLWGNASTFCV